MRNTRKITSNIFSITLKYVVPFAVVLLTAGIASAQGVAADNEYTLKKFIAMGCAFGVAIAAVGGALAQGRAAAAALEGIARNPGAKKDIQGPMIISLALIESLVIYALIISILTLNKF